MTNIAIRGHKTRGKEVIEILEMLGGKSYTVYAYKGEDPDRCYCINKETNFIDSPLVLKEVQVFSLEEFLEQFPYKVGDRVRIPEYESEVRISKMYWDGNEVQYEVVTDEVEWYSAKELNEFNEPSKEKKINQMSLANCDLDEVEIVLGDNFELKIREGKYYAIRKKILYPKTYEECCRIVNADPYIRLKYDLSDGQKYSYDVDNLQHYENIRKLLICRDAYWKIAGEQMGLGKPWEPSWQKTEERKFCIIRRSDNVVTKWETNTIVRFLVFPSEEMRDTFYENFKDLIIDCKELL